MKTDLPREKVQALFNYNPDTGALTWRGDSGRWGRIKAGTEAGAACTGGYRQVRVDGRLRMVHRLAWIHANGPICTEMIDHINGDRQDNRLCNLRQATREMNTQNIKRANSRSSHGFLGVSRQGNRWRAEISVKNRQQFLGYFPTPEAAQAVYLTAKRQLHEGCTI